MHPAGPEDPGPEPASAWEARLRPAFHKALSSRGSGTSHKGNSIMRSSRKDPDHQRRSERSKRAEDGVWQRQMWNIKWVHTLHLRMKNNLSLCRETTRKHFSIIIPHSQWGTRELLLIWATSGCSWLCLLLSLRSAEGYMVWAGLSSHSSAILHVSVLTLQLVNQGMFSRRSKGSKSRNMQVLFQTSILCLVY